MPIFDDDLYLSAALRQHLDNRGAGDGGNGEWWCAAQRSNGDQIEFMANRCGRPYEAKRVFAHDIVWGLNKHVGHGGRWILVWTHPAVAQSVLLLPDQVDYQQLHFVWLDKDADPQFGILVDDHFQEIVRTPPEKWLQDGEDGIHMFREQMRILDPSPRQQFMAARGERPPPSLRH